MANIRKLKSGNYQVQIRLSGLKPITKTFRTKTLATQFQREVEGSYQLQGALGSPDSIFSLSHYIDAYMSQYTGKDDSIVSRLKFWKSKLGEVSANKITSKQVRDTLKEITAKKTKCGKFRSGSTINRYKANLSSVFEYAKEEFGLDINPTRGIKAKSESPHRERFLSEKEQSKLLDACKKLHWKKLYLLVLMALTTGARRGELLGLKWSDIDYKQRTAKLNDTKNGTSRLLPLTAAVIQEISQFQSIGNHLIFHNSISTNKPFEIKKVFAKALAEVKIKDFRFHDLRHTAASNLAQNGANLLEIAEVLGHSNTTVTKRYAHLCIDHKRDLINRVMGEIC